MNFDYDTIPAGYYDQVFRKAAGVQSKWHHAKFERFARSMVGLKRHLDIGCGPGTFIGSLPSGRHESLGIDISASQIAYADGAYGGPGRSFLTVRPGRLPLEDNSFDVVTVIELIEHLAHGRNVEILSEAMRVLRHGGLLLVSTPNYRSSWPAVESLVRWLGGMDYSEQHITHYHRSTLNALLREAGAGNISVKGYMLIAPFTAALSWRLADTIERLEPGFLVDRFGLLLFASGRKLDGA